MNLVTKFTCLFMCLQQLLVNGVNMSQTVSERYRWAVVVVFVIRSLFNTSLSLMCDCLSVSRVLYSIHTSNLR